jgi:hypothetical protein
MMTYDPEDWTEMLAQFEKAIPNLTITKGALIQTELEKAKAQLRNVPTIEQLQAQSIRSRQVGRDGATLCYSNENICAVT